MNDDFELFPGKTLSGLFKDIYTNHITKKERISHLIVEMKDKISHNGDVAIIGPIFNNLIETSVKNDDHLVKLATIVQRIMISKNKTSDDVGFLTDEEKAQLLKDLEQTKLEVSKIDDLAVEIDDLKQKNK